MLSFSIRISVMFARQAVALGEGVEVAVAVEVEVEAQTEAEEAAEEENDQCRKLREQNEVTERGGLGAHRGRGLCCSGAGNQGRLLVAALVDFWSGEAGGQAWEVGGWDLDAARNKRDPAALASKSAVPVSQCPTVPHQNPRASIPSPRASLDSRKRASQGGIRDLSLVFRRRGQGTVQSDRPVARPKRGVSCVVARAECRSATQRRAERMSG